MYYFTKKNRSVYPEVKNVWEYLRVDMLSAAFKFCWILENWISKGYTIGYKKAVIHKICYF